MDFIGYKKSSAHFNHKLITLTNNLGGTPGNPQTPVNEPKTQNTFTVDLFSF